jgi:hypothetical protein
VSVLKEIQDCLQGCDGLVMPGKASDWGIEGARAATREPIAEAPEIEPTFPRNCSRFLSDTLMKPIPIPRPG